MVSAIPLRSGYDLCGSECIHRTGKFWSKPVRSSWRRHRRRKIGMIQQEIHDGTARKGVFKAEAVEAIRHGTEGLGLGGGMNVQASGDFLFSERAFAGPPDAQGVHQGEQGVKLRIAAGGAGRA